MPIIASVWDLVLAYDGKLAEHPRFLPGMRAAGYACNDYGRLAKDYAQEYLRFVYLDHVIPGGAVAPVPAMVAAKVVGEIRGLPDRRPADTGVPGPSYKATLAAYREAFGTPPFWFWPKDPAESGIDLADRVHAFVRRPRFFAGLGGATAVIIAMAWYMDKVPLAEMGWPGFMACIAGMGVLACLGLFSAVIVSMMLFGPSYVVRGRRVTEGVSTGAAAGGVLLPDLTPVAGIGCAIGGHALGGGGCDLSGFSIDLNL